MQKLTRGVTLVELMIVVVVIAILASIAFPNYQQYVRRANRVDAKAALLVVAAAQEKFYLQNGTYTTELSNGPADVPPGLGIAGTENGYYDLTILDNRGGLTQGYTVQAVPAGTDRQVFDTDCQLFTLNENRVRTAEDGSSNDKTEECWR